MGLRLAMARRFCRSRLCSLPDGAELVLIWVLTTQKAVNDFSRARLEHLYLILDENHRQSADGLLTILDEDALVQRNLIL